MVHTLMRLRGVKFLAIGGVSTAFQFVVMWFLVGAGVAAPIGNLLSLVFSIWLNYTLHFFITWNDRIPKAGSRILQNIVLYMTLCGVFYCCAGITIAMKITIFNLSFSVLGWFLAVAVGEVIGVGVNYLTADRVSFGRMVKAANWWLVLFEQPKEEKVEHDQASPTR